MSSWVPATTTAALLSTPLVVIIFIVGHMAVTAPSVPCPTGCDCSEDKVGLLTAKCSLNTFAIDPDEDFFSIQVLSFNNTDPLVPFTLKDDTFQAFSGVTIIELSNCSIGYIHPAAFKGLKFLQELDLSNNHITHFHRSSFNSTPKLSLLNLNNNPIEITDSFITSRSLQELRLESCSIQHIPMGAFKGLPKLKSLSLYNNSLEAIPAHTLPRGLKRLNVARNRLVNVPTEVIYNLNRIRILDLSENSINCSCKLMGLQDWLSGRGVIFDNDVLCASPAKYNGKSWSTVNEDEICNREIRMTNGLENQVYGDSSSVDTECDEMKASCDDLGEILQADQPQAKQDTEKTSENELTPNDEPAENEDSEGTENPTGQSETKETAEEENSGKEVEGEGDEKKEEEDTSDTETSQDATDDETANNEKTEEEEEAAAEGKTSEQDSANVDEPVVATKENSVEEGESSKPEEKEDEPAAKEMIGEGMTLSDAKVSENSTPLAAEQHVEPDAATSSGTASESNSDAKVDATTSVPDVETIAKVDEPATETADRPAEGRSLPISATDSSVDESQVLTTIPPVVNIESSSTSPETSPEIGNVEATTPVKPEGVGEFDTIQPSSSSTTESSLASETLAVSEASQSSSSLEPSTDAAPTAQNEPEASVATTLNDIVVSSSENPPSSSSENPPSSSSIAPEETTPAILEVELSSPSSMLPETTSSSTSNADILSSSTAETVDPASSTPETNLEATGAYASSAETTTSVEQFVPSSTSDSNLLLGVGMVSSSTESSPGTSESTTLEGGASDTVSSTISSPSSTVAVTSVNNAENIDSNLTSIVAPDQQNEPMINYSSVMSEFKQNLGPYLVVGGIILVLVVLLLVALTRCRKAPTKKRRETKLDSEMNGGTELQEITSLIPTSLTNGSKIYSSKYPNEKPSKDTMNLLSNGDDKGTNGGVISLNGNVDAHNSNNNGLWSNGTKANGKNCNGTSGKVESPGSMASMIDRGSQFFDDGVNPPIELTKVKVMMLPDSVPKTPVFVHRKYDNDNS